MALGVLALLWVAPTIVGWVSAIDLSEVDHLYAIIAGFVTLDAVVPIFPSESLLTTASNLAAQDGSTISLRRLIAAGTIGAIVGDTLLYWLSRGVGRRFAAAQVERAQRNEKVARSMAVMSRTAPSLIVFGRFVPGLRFVIGATMGLTRYPYPAIPPVGCARRFLLGRVHVHLLLLRGIGHRRQATRLDRRLGDRDHRTARPALPTAQAALGGDGAGAGTVSVMSDANGSGGGVLRRFDEVQRRRKLIGFPLAVGKRYAEDHGGWLGSLIAYYGFFSLFPLLVVFVTVSTWVLRDRPEALHRVRFEALWSKLPFVSAEFSAEVEKQVRDLAGQSWVLVVSVLVSLWERSAWCGCCRTP